MGDFKSSFLAHIDDDVITLTAAYLLDESPFSSLQKYLSQEELLFLAQTTFEDDFSDIIPAMKWPKSQ